MGFFMRTVHVVKLGLIAIVLLCMLPGAISLGDIPSVVDLKRETRGSDTVLVIQVRHNSPSSNHYVDTVEVEIDGKVEKINGLEPQTGASFTVEHALGAGAKNVRVRAHCNIHGWSQWAVEAGGEPAGSGGIPGFSPESIVLGISLAAIIVWLLRRNMSQ